MKKLYLALVLLALVSVGVYVGSPSLAQSLRPEAANATKSPAISPNLVISQIQPGTSAAPNDEWVEIHNTSSSPVDLNGHRIVYRSQNGTNDVGPFAVWTTTTIVQPGQYYLIASTSYTGTVAPDITYNPTVCACSMSAANGGLAIRQGEMNTGAVLDAVGWGTGSNVFFEGSRTVAPGSGNSSARLQSGCQDTDNNAGDFQTLSPFSPRNMATAAVTCSGTGTTLFSSLSASPTTVSPGATALLRVTVIPATTPPSTSIGVEGNLTAIGGFANQTFYDNGTNGDVTPGDNVFSYLAVVPAGTAGGNYVITSVSHDAQGRTANSNVTITVNAPFVNEDPLILGNPSAATSDVSNENNYLMTKPQYSLSYNRSKATANWVAWRLDTSWLGAFNNGSFGPDDMDTTLPAGWYRVNPDTDYDEPIYDRGHMCPAGDRSNSNLNNDATFLGTNIVPQHPDNNQGPWNEFENYCRTLAGQGNEIYIITGPTGNMGTIGSTPENRIVIPTQTWKVVVVLPNGSDDLRRVSRSTRAFGVIMPNTAGIRFTAWRNFRVTVDAVEALTGHNFFSNVPRNTQEYIESRRDTL